MIVLFAPLNTQQTLITDDDLRSQFGVEFAQTLTAFHIKTSKLCCICLCCRVRGSQADLAAAVLPLLSNPSGKPLLADCWPLLNTETAKQSQQWLPIVVMVAEAALLQGGREVAAGAIAASPSAGGAAASSGGGVTLADVYSAVKEHVRLAARVPQLKGWEKWQLSSALAEVQGVGFGEKGLAHAPPAPDVAAMTPEEQQQAMADWETQKQQSLETVSARLWQITNFIWLL